MGGEIRMDVTQKQLAEILNISARQVRELTNVHGLFEREVVDGKKQKKYRLEKCVPEYLSFKLKGEAKGGTFYNKEREQAEHEQIKKKIDILKLRKLRRELHEAADVEEFLTNMLVSFKSRLLSIPQKVAPIVVSEDDVNRISDILEKEIFEALKELSEYDPLKIDKNADLEFEDDEEEDEDADV